MPVQDPTANYGWDLPTVAGSEDTWGTETNESVGDFEGAISSVDEVLALLQADLDTFEANILLAEGRVLALQNAKAEAVYVRTNVPFALDPPPYSLTPIMWPVPEFQVGGTFWDAVNLEMLTIPSEGGYNIRAQITLPTFARNGDDDRFAWELSIHKNGSVTPIAVSRTPEQINNMSTRSGDQTLRVAALDTAVQGDTYEVRIYRGTPAASRTDTALSRGPTDHFAINKLPSPVDVPLADMQWGNPMIEDRWNRLDCWGVSAAESWWANFDNGKIVYRPLMVYRTVIIDQLAFGVYFATVDRNNVLLGIYRANNATGMPSTLMSQVAEIELDGETAKAVFDEPLLSAVTLQPNTLYWFAFAQYNISGADQVSPFTFDENNLGSYLGWAGSTSALQDPDQATGIVSTPSPLLTGPLPANADLTALAWVTRSTPSIAAHLDEIP